MEEGPFAGIQCAGALKLVELHAQRLYARGHMTQEDAWLLADAGREPEAARASRELEAQAWGVACADCHRELRPGLWLLVSLAGMPRMVCGGRRVVTCYPVRSGE